MKKLLLTTTALAGMTGVAAADVSLSGSGSINYKTAEGGNEAVFSSDARLIATMTSSGAYSGAISFDIGEYGATGAAAPDDVNISGAAVSATTPFATIQVSEAAGIDDAAETFSAVSGMNGIGAEDNASVSLSASLGDIAVVYTSDLNLDSDNTSIGASGSLGGLSFTFGSMNEDMGISLSGSALGGTVTVALAEIGTNSDSGVSIAIPVSGSTLTLTADDTSGVDGWSAKVATTVNGASVTVGTNDAGTSTVDVSAAIAGGATFVADYSTAANSSEFGISYDLGGGATFLLSHSEFAASDDYAPGTNMKLSFAF